MSRSLGLWFILDARGRGDPGPSTMSMIRIAEGTITSDGSQCHVPCVRGAVGLAISLVHLLSKGARLFRRGRALSFVQL